MLALFALALDFVALGAPFIAALEIIVYAGAIMVVILFVIMMVAGPAGSHDQERRWLAPRAWIVPGLLATGLAALSVIAFAESDAAPAVVQVFGPREIGALLFSDWVIAVELASVLLLAGLLGAYYLGARD